jgi:hypothetical protein
MKKSKSWFAAANIHKKMIRDVGVWLLAEYPQLSTFKYIRPQDFL